ncbi:response regulator transcription factor [Aurantimonas sp. HBX-1]|uniref:response regulator transcription factor n=1 Tax=Aurantimonas sp. HBX-1 TaxID=2906072 RepID=UPI001F31EA63|nr:response regulator transcription factor [Aurantimonas sp. HBX-1]UIJ71753.1 response regulator transcription factor [Aurantimonas sp. HBX-1]
MPCDGADPRRIVLVVDDSPETIEFLTTALEEQGLTVLVALDGGKAIAIARRITPDVVLLDAVMPGMDGFETCRRLKQDASLAHVPVIFMTGLSETEHIVHAFAVGGVDYVTKPVVIEQILARMRVHQENARMTRAARLALDTTGRFLLAVDGDGTVRWMTPQARRLLTGEGDADPLPGALAGELQRLRRGEAARHPGNPGLGFALLGQIGADEFLLRLSRAEGDETDAAALRDGFGLTAREAEVLLWIARGKSNRDVAEILALSPRTVNKHLETIFRKLGVENRSAATASAMNLLAERR